LHGIGALGRYNVTNERFIGRPKHEPADENLNHFNETACREGPKGCTARSPGAIAKGKWIMTKPIHPRVVGPDGKLVRHRRTKAQMARARIAAEMHAETLAALPAIQARLAATPAWQIRKAERTLWRWSHPKY
jgi:hypothetical protein